VARVAPLRRRFVAALTLGCTALCAASCGGEGPKLHPVTGKLFHDKSPAEGATVVFHLKDGPPAAPKPSGKVGADGTFTLTTHPHGDGAPAGEYVVVVTWLPADARGRENVKNKLPDQYASPDRSPLRATVKDGPTDLDPIVIPK
jgi:hypothetical protein